jgi:hypothetical protein
VRDKDQHKTELIEETARNKQNYKKKFSVYFNFTSEIWKQYHSSSSVTAPPSSSMNTCVSMRYSVGIIELKFNT